jgi:hypothetical protein
LRPIDAIDLLHLSGRLAASGLSGPDDGAAQVQPRRSQEAILYVNSGQNSVMAVIATGAYLRPFNTKSLSQFRIHLFNAIQCIAAPSGDGTFLERYAYVLNGDGMIVVGKYDPQSLAGGQPVIGWDPWSGAATVTWIAANGSSRRLISASRSSKSSTIPNTSIARCW